MSFSCIISSFELYLHRIWSRDATALLNFLFIRNLDNSPLQGLTTCGGFLFYTINLNLQEEAGEEHHALHLSKWDTWHTSRLEYG